jgi:hypothetical protein
MAKRKGKPSMLGIFKGYFQAHPEWLRTRSNDAVLAQFKGDHPNTEITPKVRQAMFNAKNWARKGKKGRRGRRRKVQAVQAAMRGPQRHGGALQLLENHVDDSLAMARTIGKEKISDVINHLHRARNMLVVAIES